MQALPSQWSNTVLRTVWCKIFTMENFDDEDWDIFTREKLTNANVFILPSPYYAYCTHIALLDMYLYIDTQPFTIYDL